MLCSSEHEDNSRSMHAQTNSDCSSYEETVDTNLTEMTKMLITQYLFWKTELNVNHWTDECEASTRPHSKNKNIYIEAKAC